MSQTDLLRRALDDVVTKITWRPDKTALVHDSEALNTLIGCVVMVTSQPAAARAERGLPLDLPRLRAAFTNMVAVRDAPVLDDEFWDAIAAEYTRLAADPQSPTGEGS